MQKIADLAVRSHGFKGFTLGWCACCFSHLLLMSRWMDSVRTMVLVRLTEERVFVHKLNHIRHAINI